MEAHSDSLSNCLDGVKVIELASVLAGPSVGMFLAELGAEVLKVEMPSRGDVTRSWKLSSEKPNDERPAYFCSVNWGKTSLGIDLGDPLGLEKLRQLISNCDILLTSFKPGDEKKFGLEEETLLTKYPALIYASIIGYSDTDHRVAYDAVIQAESGWWYINGLKGERGHKLPVAVVDVFAGHQLKQGILAALIKRLNTGRGSRVVVSLYDAALSALVNQASNWLVADHDPLPLGSEHPNIFPYGTAFICRDGVEIMLAIGSDKQFHQLCLVLQIQDIFDQFSTNAVRVRKRDELREILNKACSEINSSELLGQLNEQNVPCAKVRPVSEALDTARPEILLQGSNLKGIRQAVFCSDARLSEPPHLTSQA